MDEPDRLDRDDDRLVPRRAGRRKAADDGIFEAVVNMRLATRCFARLTMRGLEDIAELGRDAGAYHCLVNLCKRLALGEGTGAAQGQQCRG